MSGVYVNAIAETQPVSPVDSGDYRRGDRAMKTALLLTTLLLLYGVWGQKEGQWKVVRRVQR